VRVVVAATPSSREPPGTSTPFLVCPVCTTPCPACYIWCCGAAAVVGTTARRATPTKRGPTHCYRGRPYSGIHTQQITRRAHHCSVWHTASHTGGYMPPSTLRVHMCTARHHATAHRPLSSCCRLLHSWSTLTNPSDTVNIGGLTGAPAASGTSCSTPGEAAADPSLGSCKGGASCNSLMKAPTATSREGPPPAAAAGAPGRPPLAAYPPPPVLLPPPPAPPAAAGGGPGAEGALAGLLPLAAHSEVVW
jgi:hypothetical protein